MRNVCLIILTTISINASGQSFIGIKGGLSFTNVSTNNFIEGTDSRTSFSGGLSYEYFLKDNYSISFDLITNQRGFTIDMIFIDDQGDPTGQKTTTKFNYDYLSLPIKTGIYVGQKKVNAFGNMGVVPSILINAKTISPSYETDGINYPGETIDTKEQVNKFDFAGLLEIGANYKATNKFWLFSSLTYQYSFTTITNSEYFPESKVRHNGLTVSFGLKYKLSKE